MDSLAHFRYGTGPPGCICGGGQADLTGPVDRLLWSFPDQPQCRGWSPLQLFRANVLQAFGKAVHIDPTGLEERFKFFFRNSYRATARPEPNVRKTPLGTQEVNQPPRNNRGGWPILVRLEVSWPPPARRRRPLQWQNRPLRLGLRRPLST